MSTPLGNYSCISSNSAGSATELFTVMAAEPLSATITRVHLNATKPEVTLESKFAMYTYEIGGVLILALVALLIYVITIKTRSRMAQKKLDKMKVEPRFTLMPPPPEYYASDDIYHDALSISPQLTPSIYSRRFTNTDSHNYETINYDSIYNRRNYRNYFQPI